MSNGTHQTWIGVGGTMTTDRTIQAISGNEITLDVPLSEHLMRKDLSPRRRAHVTVHVRRSHLQVGVEDSLVIGPAVNVPISQAQYTVMQMNNVIDAWVRDIVVQDTQNSFALYERTKRVTLENVSITHTIAHTGDGNGRTFHFGNADAGRSPAVERLRLVAHPHARSADWSHRRGPLQ